MRKETLLLAVLLVCSSGTVLAEESCQLARFTPPDRGLAALSWDSPCRSGPIPALHYPRWDAGFFIGGATTPGNATLKLKATGAPLFNQVEQTIEVDLSGILIGLSLGCAITDRLSCRIEAFDVVPASEDSQTVTTLQTGGPVAREFISHFHWDGVHGEGAVKLLDELAFVGGLSYESLNMRLNSTAPVSNVSRSIDEGNAIFHTINLYGGAQYTLGLPYSGSLMVRVTGLPWVYCHWDYNMTFRNPVSPFSSIQNSTSGSIQNGSFGEILLRGSLRIGFAELGGFTKLSAITLGKTFDMNAEDISAGTTLQQPFDVRFTRRTIEAGGFVTIPF
jgi:hypothetical protein